LPVPVPAISDYRFLSASLTPPAEATCFAQGRRCFTAAAMERSYNLPQLYHDELRRASRLAIYAGGLVTRAAAALNLTLVIVRRLARRQPACCPSPAGR
jgi:hypothetical protein